MTRDLIRESLEREDSLTPHDAETLLQRVDANGTSDPALLLDELLAANRAGINEESLTIDEILDQYES
jgi:hypothetical protein